MVGHLSRLDPFVKQLADDGVIQETFPDENLLVVAALLETTWYADIVNYLACKVFPFEFKFQENKRLMAKARQYFWDDPYFYMVCVVDVVRRCVPHEEVSFVLQCCHCIEVGAHHEPIRTTHKVLQCGFFLAHPPQGCN